MQHLTEHELQEMADKKVQNNAFNAASKHLMECPVCTERMNSIYQLSRSIRQIPLERPSKDFTSRVISRIGIKEAPSLVWRVMTILAPLVMLAFVVVVIVGALQVSGASEEQRIPTAITEARTALNSITSYLETTVATINQKMKILLPFAFAGNSLSLLIFLVCFLSAIGLLDKYLFAHLIKRR